LDPDNASTRPFYRVFEVVFDDAGYYSIQVSAENVCGTGNTYSEYISVSDNPYYYPYSNHSYYPNPASNILNIEIDAQVQSSAPATTAGKQLKQEKSYDLRLYDGQGALLRQQKAKGGTVQFNVANLPDGVYYLHIYDGSGNRPEMRQIVVEH
jgi:hypothetical protein